jgi:hypothetical protein
LQARFLTPVGTRRKQHPVTRIRAERGHERRRIEARNRVADVVRILEPRPAQPVVERHAWVQLPRIGHVPLHVAPALPDRPLGSRLAEIECHPLEEQVPERVARRVAFSGEAHGISELRRFGRSLIEHVLVLLVVAADDAGLEEVVAERRRVVVLEHEEVLIVLERRHVLQIVAVVAASEENRMAAVRAVLLDAVREHAWDRRVDLIVQLWGQTAARDGDHVGGVRERQRVDCR